MYWGEKMSNKATISKRDERLLHTKSGNRCAMCKPILVDVGNPSAACVGENAHIYGEKPDAARYDSTKDSSFVNSEQNLIFLCCNCHKKIDTDVASYPANELFALKAQHEQWVTQKLEEKSISYSFSELEVLAKYLVSSTAPAQTNSSFSLLKIDEKIKKNSLLDVQRYILSRESLNGHALRNEGSKQPVVAFVLGTFPRGVGMRKVDCTAPALDLTERRELRAVVHGNGLEDL